MRILLLACISISLLQGCIPAPLILEDIQFVQTVGYDYLDNNYILGTVSVPKIQTTEDGSTTSETFTAESHTSKGIGRIIQNKSPKPVEVGRLGVALYGMDLAKKTGVFEMLDSIFRDTRISKGVYLAVVNGRANELLDYNYSISESTSKYLRELIEQNAKEYIPKMDVHTFMYKYYGRGMDPFMPLLERDGEKIKVKGIALFRKDKYVDYIDFKEAFFFKMLYEDTSQGFFEIKFNNNQFVNIENLSSSVKYKILNANTNPKVKVYLDLTGRVVEGAKIPLEQKKIINQIEKKVKKNITKSGNSMVSKFKELNIDPLGIGDHAKSQTRNFNFDKWQDSYSEIPIEFNINVKITQPLSIE